MIVRFADTLGRLLDSSSDDGKEVYVQLPETDVDLLCSAWIDPFSGDLIVIDRLPSQEISQLPERALITLLRRARTLTASAAVSDNESLVIYLPRIHASMFAEARLQRLLYETLVEGSGNDGANVAIISI